MYPSVDTAAQDRGYGQSGASLDKRTAGNGFRHTTPPFSTLEIHFLLFKNEFREGTYTPLWGVSQNRQVDYF
jgi:hypothetical protein